MSYVGMRPEHGRSLEDTPILPLHLLVAKSASRVVLPSQPTAPIRRPRPDSRLAKTTKVPRVRPRSPVLRWPVLLCALISGIFGGVALVKSPIGHRPAVQRVIGAIHAKVMHR